MATTKQLSVKFVGFWIIRIVGLISVWSVRLKRLPPEEAMASAMRLHKLLKDFVESESAGSTSSSVRGR